MECTWRPDEGELECTSTADDNSMNLCQPHFDEACRRRKAKVEGWKVIALETEVKRGKMLLSLYRANNDGRDALIVHAAESGDIAGDSTVTVVHGRTNSQLYNVLTGNIKSSTLRQPGWRTEDWIKGVILEPIDGLSMEAARVYANAYNDSLSECGLGEDTKAIVT